MMNTSARQALPAREAAQAVLKDSRGSMNSVAEEASRCCDSSQNLRKIRVRVDSGNRAWHDSLIKMLGNRAGLEMLGDGVNEIFRVEKILDDSPDVLLLTSCGNLDSDISNIRKVRVAAPGVRIVMFGGAGAEREFLQYVRAGNSGLCAAGSHRYRGMGNIGGGACRESMLSEGAVCPVVQLFRARSDKFAFGDAAAAAGFDAP
jgi:hypothetical protein